jgi:hypothetical protein
MGPRVDIEKGTHGKEDADSSKDHTRGRKYLPNEYENADLE